MPRDRRPKRALDHDDMAEVPGLGYMPYSWLEREAICMESGLSEREALRVASTDYQREMGAATRKRHGSSYAALSEGAAKKG